MFMLSERMSHEDTYPSLSRPDIEELLSHFLPRRDDVTKDEIIQLLEHRHRKRQAAIESHTRKSMQAKGVHTGDD